MYGRGSLIGKRIFIGFTEIAGIYNALCQGMRDQGLEVTYIGGANHPFAYESTAQSRNIAAIYDYLRARRDLTPRRQFVAKAWWMGVVAVATLPFFCWAVCKHDVFILVFSTSFFRKNRDLPLLRLLGKRVICAIYHGGDCRPPYLNGSLTENRKLTDRAYARRAKAMRRQAARIEKYASVVIGAPLTSQFFAKPFVNFFHLGIPRQWIDEKAAAQEKGGAVRIVHSPSNPAAKGTALVREVIGKLSEKGYRIEFVEITGQPNAVVMEELERCDFVIDQVYSDTPMAAFATEAAAYGKPAVVGGYGWDILRKRLPADAFPPSAICHPAELETTIERLITDVSYRERLGHCAGMFVRDNWSPRMVAMQYLHLVNNEIPVSWWCDPKEIIYVHGYGSSEEKVRKVLAKLIALCGAEALQCRHHPELEKALLVFADSGIESSGLCE
jgi:glycosyltransferase involved in cell wall biosynthesis